MIRFVLYRIFGRRIGRIIAGIFFLIMGLFYLLMNLSDPANASGTDWFYCSVLLIVGAISLGLGIFATVRSKNAGVVQPDYSAGQWSSPSYASIIQSAASTPTNAPAQQYEGMPQQYGGQSQPYIGPAQQYGVQSQPYTGPAQQYGGQPQQWPPQG